MSVARCQSEIEQRINRVLTEHNTGDLETLNGIAA